MEAANRDLDAYVAWLRRRGRSPGTIRQYRYHMKRVLSRAEAGKDMTSRLTDRSLSPKYRRMSSSVLRSWAKFTKDAALLEELDEVHLPAAVRKTPKVPLSKTAWRAVIDEIDAADYLTDPMRAVLGLMATRGLRSGDVLRLTRKEIADALKTDILSYVAKGERRLEFGVLPSFKGYLEMLIESFGRHGIVADLVVTSRAHDPEARMATAGANVVRALREVGEAVGPRVLGIEVDELHPHKLRRTYATMFYEACGRDPMALRNHMQWASVEVAMGYVDHSRRDELDSIARKMMG